MKKVIVLKNENGTQEFHGLSLFEVVNITKGQLGNLFLQRWDNSNTGIGMDFTSESIIGSIQDELTMENYYRAYDEII